jgi:hypothetical protein
MKSKTLISLLLALVMLLTLVTTISAGPATQKIKYSSRSDASIIGTGTSAWVGSSILSVGDTNGGTGYRGFYKFNLGGIKASSIDWVELELHIYSSTVNGTEYTSAPYPNIELGDTLLVPIDNYGGKPSGLATYDSANVSAPVVLIPASNTAVTSPVSVNVTEAVLAAKTARSNVVTFSVQTTVETDLDGKYDVWKFYTREAGEANRPKLIVHLKQ